MAIEDHLDYQPGAGHLKEMRVLSEGLRILGVPAWKTDGMAVFLWKAMRKSDKNERVYLQGGNK